MTTPETVAVTLVRMEGKLDRISDAIIQLGKDADDHEIRIRILESRPVVTTKALWFGIGSAAAIVSAAAPFIAQLYSTK